MLEDKIDGSMLEMMLVGEIKVTINQRIKLMNV
jgi:hypothetical protein